MNVFDRIINKNVRKYIREDIVLIYKKPHKKSTLYKRKNGKLISHRALVRTVKKLVKEKITHNI